MKRLNQKGFSLVELVVVMAILSIIGIAAFGFFQTSTNAYNNTGAEVNLQYEAQLTQNQLDNLIIDTTKSLDYYYGSDAANRTSILCDTEMSESDPEYKGFLVKNEDAQYLLEWSKSKKTITLKKYVWDASGNLVLDGEPDGDLLAEYVNSFEIDLSRAASKRVVGFRFTFYNENGHKQYVAQHNITMRNRVPINGTVVEEYPDSKGFAKRVEIYYTNDKGDEKKCTDDTIKLEKAGIAQSVLLRAEVIGYNNPRQKVAWALPPELDSSIASIVVIDDTHCRVDLTANAVKTFKVIATAIDEADKLTDVSAHTFIGFKTEGNGNGKGFVRGGEELLKIPLEELVGVKYIDWGFVTIIECEDDGNTVKNYGNRHGELARRLVRDSEGNVVIANAVWGDIEGKDTDPNLKLPYTWNVASENDGKGYYEFNDKWKEEKWSNDHCFVLDETDERLSFGQCYLKVGTYCNWGDGITIEHGFQIAVKAKLYDENGKFIKETPIIGSTTPDKDNRFYLEPVKGTIVNCNNENEFFSSTRDGANSKGVTFKVKKGESIDFQITGHGWYEKPYVEEVFYASGDPSCMLEPDSSKWFDQETGRVHLKIDPNYEGHVNVGLNFYMGGRQLYWVYFQTD